MTWVDLSIFTLSKQKKKKNTLVIILPFCNPLGKWSYALPSSIYL